MTPEATSQLLGVESATSDVAKFYAGKSVFITGGTGFLGKVFVEKLLYSCPDLDTLYLLVRYKSGVEAKQRLEKLFEKPLFSRIKKEKPDVLKKVVAIPGDLTAPNLGIDPGDEQMLVEKVSVFIHSAATIKFNEALKKSLEVNVDGTKHALNLAQCMKNIQVFVYISTAYSHIQESVLEEVVYSPPVDLEEAYTYANQLQNNKDDTILNSFLRGHPNTYTFTKALAENYVIQNHKSLPLVIVRPSIVSASYNEPVAGWVDNWCGATAIISGIIKGLIRVLYSRSDVLLDLIPLDYASNLIITAAAMSERSKDLKIYNCCSSWANPITIEYVVNKIVRYAKENDKNSYPTVNFTMQKWLLYSLQFLMQTLPAYVVDFWLRVAGKRPRFVKIQFQLNTVCELLEFFTSNSWVMKCENTRDLHSSLSRQDQETFPCDPKTIDWNEYMMKYCDGIFKYLLKS